MRHVLTGPLIVLLCSCCLAFAQKTALDKGAAPWAKAKSREPVVAAGLRRDNQDVKAEPGDKIVAIAVAQEGRGPDEVGKELERSHDDLSHYLKHGDPWCSEFVSWTYKTAGFPFAEGNNRNWMLVGSNGIKKWFQRNGKFIARTDSDWRSFQPHPGDYIRYNNDHGGHSGIVCSASGEELHTVEGNVGNKVVLRTINNWRDRENIDGIGQRRLSKHAKKDK